MKELTRSTVLNATGWDVRDCYGLVWRATWTPGTAKPNLTNALQSIQADLQKYRDLSCLFVATDFTLYKGPQQYTCADEHDANKRSCKSFEEWRPTFEKGLMQFHPIIMANFTHLFETMSAELHTDPETLNTFLDLGGLVQTRKVLHYGTHDVKEGEEKKNP